MERKGGTRLKKMIKLEIPQDRHLLWNLLTVKATPGNRAIFRDISQCITSTTKKFLSWTLASF